MHFLDRQEASQERGIAHRGTDQRGYRTKNTRETVAEKWDHRNPIFQEFDFAHTPDNAAGSDAEDIRRKPADANAHFDH